MKLRVVETAATPNPNAIKFVLDARVATRPRSITSRLDAAADTLAEDLLCVPGVTAVFYFENFITVSKSSIEDWPEIMAQSRRIIESAEVESLTALMASQLIPDPTATRTEPANSVELNAVAADLAARYVDILAIIEKDIRPGLTMDGGGLEILGLSGTTLKLRYQGACGSCPSSTTGTLAFICQTLHDRIDPRLQVEIVS